MTRDEKKLLIGLLNSMKYQDFKGFETCFTMLISTIYMKSDSILVREIVSKYVTFLYTMDGSLLIKSLMKSRSLYNVLDNVQAGVVHNESVLLQIRQTSELEFQIKNGTFKTKLFDYL